MRRDARLTEVRDNGATMHMPAIITTKGMMIFKARLRAAFRRSVWGISLSIEQIN
jgi:hypothetical protein